MFGSSLPSVVCMKGLIYVICVCLCIVVSNTDCIVLLFYLSSSCVPMLTVSLDCHFFDCPFGIL